VGAPLGEEDEADRLLVLLRLRQPGVVALPGDALSFQSPPARAIAAGNSVAERRSAKAVRRTSIVMARI